MVILQCKKENSYASWIIDQDDHTLTSHWVFMPRGGAISWSSKKQTCILDSTIATEFIALASDSKGSQWLQDLLYEIPICPKPVAPIYIVYGQVHNGKSRHIRFIYNYIWDLILNGIVTIWLYEVKWKLSGSHDKRVAKGHGWQDLIWDETQTD